MSSMTGTPFDLEGARTWLASGKLECSPLQASGLMQSIDGKAGYAEMAEWEEMTERGKNGVKGLDMRLVNEYDPMKSLKGLRVKARLSTWEAAKRVGIPEYQWAGIERGEEKPDIKVARRIASLFKTEWVWIRELKLK